MTELQAAIKGLSKLSTIAKHQSISSVIMAASVVIGVISLFLPWVVFEKVSYQGDVELVWSYSGIQLLTADPGYFDARRCAVVLFPFSCVLCVLTIFFLKVNEKTDARGPLYVFFGFLAALALLDVYFGPTIPVSVFAGHIIDSFYTGFFTTGFNLAEAATIGIFLGASVAILERRPCLASKRALLIGILTGTVVGLSFFFFRWVIIWYRVLSPTSVTGFNIAHSSYYLSRFLNLNVLSQIMQHLVPLVLYMIPIAGGLVIISPFFRPTSGRVIRIASGIMLLVSCCFFLSLFVPSNWTEHSVAEGFWFTAITGLFLLFSEIASFLKDYLTKSND